jgi:hypothetical protein
MASCEALNCGHVPKVRLKNWSHDLPVPDTAKAALFKVWARRIRMRVNVQEPYAWAHGAGRTGG